MTDCKMRNSIVRGQYVFQFILLFIAFMFAGQ